MSYVERFHQEVELEVRAQLAKQTPGVGFLDRRSIEPGDRWRFRLQQGACTTRTMLALYSPSYFQSEWCAQEWTVFAERRMRHQVGGGSDRHLLGVTWRRGPGPVPDGVDDQFLTGDFGSVYEKQGLYYLAPERNEPMGPEFKKIVAAVGSRLATVLYEGTALPRLDLVEAQSLTPRFGPALLRPVDLVVVYTDLNSDTEWGRWTIDELVQKGYTVDAEVVSAPDEGSVGRVRQALRRAGRVLVLVSNSFFSHGAMSAAALDVALGDGSTDWQRMIPVFIDPPRSRSLPTSFRQFTGPALTELDEEGVRRLIVRSAEARARTSGRPNGVPPRFPGRPLTAAGFPGGAATMSPAQRHAPLVEALLTADSVKDAMIRPIWVRQTGIDVESLDLEELPLRVLLFELIDRSTRQAGDCSALATALDALEPGSPAAERVARIVDGLQEAREQGTGQTEAGSEG
ncbi:TIR domain-containing protein [Streptomyces bungoensis]